MNIIFLAALFVYKALSSVIGASDERKLKSIVVTEKIRCRRYYKAILFLWGSALAVFVMSIIGSISLADIGFRHISFNYNIWFTSVTLILSGLLLVFSLHRIIASLVSAKYRQKQFENFSDGAGGGNIFPRSKKEKKIWLAVSLTAGICEEIIYRGFVVFLLQAIFPDIPIFLIILIPSVMFGIGHLYQGLSGVISTGIAGAVFMCLFLVTDSLIPVMILHFLIDFSSVFLLSESEEKGLPATNISKG
ncbi:MAG: CPBP family intramembrane metalloprotease [Defluviitaleaceae bacterium]|nr:CPBP family intramembrane metalloprotease [Defluviitaleaceae bacterium]